MYLHTLRRIVALLLLTPTFAFGQSLVERATVHIQIVGHIGQDLGDAQIEQFKLEANNKDFARRFRHNSASGLPFGVYHLQARTTGTYTSERIVRVFQPDVWVVIGLVFGVEGGPLPWKLTGRVKGHSIAKGPVWVRLSGVYPEAVMDTMTNDSGDFALSGIVQGLYVLVTSQDGHVLDVRTVYIPASEPLLIDLKPDQ